MAEWAPLSILSLAVSYGATSPTSRAPCLSHPGRDPAKRSSMIHWLNGSVKTAPSSRRPSPTFKRGQVGVGRRWDDPVNHRVRTGALAFEPAERVGGMRGEPFGQQPGKDLAVSRQVIAREQSQAGKFCTHALAQGLGQVRIKASSRQFEIERAIGRAGIALFSDGEADDLRRGRDQADCQLSAAPVRNEHFA